MAGDLGATCRRPSRTGGRRRSRPSGSRPPARWVAEEVPVESVRDLPDGDVEVRLRVTNPAWLRSTLIQLAPYVRSISPRSLADDVAGTAREALAVYGE